MDGDGDGDGTVWTVVPTAVGELQLTSRDGVLTRIGLPGRHVVPAVGSRRDDVALAAAAEALRAFMAGERRGFALDLDLPGSPFHRRVWRELQAVPYGRTVTYAELAARAGRPGAARAAGTACGRNPIPIVVPCHRIVGSGGGLGGYGGGLPMKRWLLDLEREGRPPAALD